MAQDQIAYPSRSLPQTPISALITTSLRQARSGIARPGAKSDRPTTAPDCHPPDTPTITAWRAPPAPALPPPDPFGPWGRRSLIGTLIVREPAAIALMVVLPAAIRRL